MKKSRRIRRHIRSQKRTACARSRMFRTMPIRRRDIRSISRQAPAASKGRVGHRRRHERRRAAVGGDPGARRFRRAREVLHRQGLHEHAQIFPRHHERFQRHLQVLLRCPQAVRLRDRAWQSANDEVLIRLLKNGLKSCQDFMSVKTTYDNQVLKRWKSSQL